MIELIFVIVIISILAVVAIPRLAATRTDAQVAKLASNLATVVSDLGAHHIAADTFTGNWETLTNVPLTTDNAGTTTAKGTAWAGTTPVYLGVGATVAKTCYKIQADTNGTVEVTETGSDVTCIAAHTVTEKNNLSLTAGTMMPHIFTGAGI
jgi:type II secretory pathway pseudopilin PulG